MSILASKLQPIRSDHDGTGIALMAEHIYGGKGILFWIMQISTFAILILAANTAYADFPRLSSIIARDGFLPRQFANRGDRLVFSNGVIFLAVVAGVLIIVFDGDISKLIPLYAFGVFTGFTLSQTGMVRHHLRLREPKWRLGMTINVIGAVTTFLIATVVVVSKFTEGAWIPAALIPLVVLALLQHRQALPARARRGAGARRLPRQAAHPLRGRARRQRQPRHARGHRLRPQPGAGADRRPVRRAGRRRGARAAPRSGTSYDVGIELHTISSPYRELTRPVLDFIDEIDAERPDDIITVVIPEFVTKVSSQWLHNQTALALKARLLYRPDTVVVSVPIHVDATDDRRGDGRPLVRPAGGS